VYINRYTFLPVSTVILEPSSGSTNIYRRINTTLVHRLYINYHFDALIIIYS